MFSVAYNLYRWSGELDETNTRPARYSANENLASITAGEAMLHCVRNNNNSCLDFKMRTIIISISDFSKLENPDPFLLNFLYINF